MVGGVLARMDEFGKCLDLFLQKRNNLRHLYRKSFHLLPIEFETVLAIFSKIFSIPV